MRVLGLFAGIGGLELGIGLAVRGARTVCYVERDAFAAAVLVARMEDKTLEAAPIWDDVSTFDGKPWRGVVDCIAGGFPCQDVSFAGKGEGLDGARSGLWSEYARIIREVGPRYVIVENVAALTSRGLDRVLADLAELGFDAEWDCFSAAGVGAPHLRRRIFILAQRVPDAERDAVWLESERGTGRAQAADEGDAEPRHMGESMADRERERLERLEPARSKTGAVRRSGGASVADAEIDDHGRVTADMGHANGSLCEARAGSTEATHSRGDAMGDTDRGRCEGEWPVGVHGGDDASRGDVDRPDNRLSWPPGPGDAEGWREWIAAGGPEPAVRRGADGSAYRMDRLRCLGNGVVPSVAARAWRTLIRRLK